MALIVITVSDTEDGEVSVAVITEPAISMSADVKLTGAQSLALDMLNATPAGTEVDPRAT